MQFSKAYAKTFVTKDEYRALYGETIKAHEKLHKGTGEGSDFIGWLRLPEIYDEAEAARIQKAAEKIRKTSELLIVIGVGGSYLGAKAAIEMLRTPLSDEKPRILFAGHNTSGPYLAALLELAETKDFSINVISKSGTTTEPAIAFRLFKNLMEKKYGSEGARERIFVTTDKEKGALFSLAKEAGYERFVVPDDIGGRYSVLTAVGLLPIAAAGIDIFSMLQGARAAQEKYSNPDPEQNDCYQYAIARNVLYRKGKTIEILASYDERLHYFAEWWKQLYGESEGKDKKGIFPAALDFPTDLHSLGQYVQDGRRDLLETILYVESVPRDVEIPPMEGNGDGLAFLEGKTLSEVNRQAFLGTILAHVDGGVPCLVITIEKLDAYHFGQMVYFFEKACAISGYLLGVNPFDQPGVEAYKKNMFALLGKPGYAEKGESLLKRLESF